MKKLLITLALLGVSVAMFAQTAQQQALNKEILKLTNQQTDFGKTPYKADIMPKVIVNSNGEAYQLITVPKDVDKTPGTDMFAADESAIFPGAIVYADTDFADGRPTLVGLPVGTADIFVEFNGGNETPAEEITLTKKAVSNYIWKVLNNTKDAYAAPVNFNADTKYSSSTSEVCYSLGIDAKYMQSQVKVDTKTTNSETKIIKTQDFTQKFYTVSITPHDITELYKYFGSNTTAELFKNRVSGRQIAVINTVTYGRRAFYFEIFETKDFKFTGNQSVDYNGGSLSVKATADEDIAKSSKTNNVFMWMKGGSNQPATDVLAGKTVREAFAREGSLKVGPSNQGIPIYYTAINLATLKPLQAHATGKYSETSYIKCPKLVNWTITNKANTAGDCVKFKAMYNVVVVTGDPQHGYTAEEVKGKGTAGDDRYIDYIENVYNNGKTIRRTMPHPDVTKAKTPSGKSIKLDDCYILSPVYYTIRSKTAEGQKWSESDRGYFDVTGGSVNVVIQGSALAGSKSRPYVHSSSTPRAIKR